MDWMVLGNILFSLYSLVNLYLEILRKLIIYLVWLLFFVGIFF